MIATWLCRARTRARMMTGALSAGLSVVSCLPSDTRPVPGSLYVTVTADTSLLGAPGATILTADGWAVSYDRFLLSIGRASFDGDSCAKYYDGDYRRLFDMQVPGPQKLSILYALGHCELGFGLSGPSSDSVLGQGVTQADLASMGVPGTDDYATNRGTALYVKGRAANATTSATKTFTWAFRSRVSYSGCSSAGDAGSTGMDLTSGTALSVDLRIHGETLLLDSPDPAHATLRFDALAAADDKYGNGDGDITLSELKAVPLSDVAIEHRYAELSHPDAGTSTWETLEAYVYLGLFPKVVRFEEDGTCTTKTGERRR